MRAELHRVTWIEQASTPDHLQGLLGAFVRSVREYLPALILYSALVSTHSLWESTADQVIVN